MPMSLKSGTVSRLIGAAAALWLGAGSAWAGGGSGDAQSLQNLLTTLCSVVGMTTSSAPCPQLTNITEAVLEAAGLSVTPPEVIRAQNAFVPTVAVNAVNPPAGPTASLSPFPQSNIMPLAFVSAQNTGGTAKATQLGNPSANNFFYAATDGVPPAVPGTRGTPPTTLYLLFDYPPLTNPTPAIAKGGLADICLPLTVLNGDNTESPIPTLLRVLNASSPPGNAVVAVGSCSGTPTGMATDLNLSVSVTFQPSANSAAKHAIIEVQVPLLVTGATDPAYFFTFSPVLSFVREPIFINDELGFTPTSKGLPNLPIGMSPVAAHLTANIASNIGGGQNSQGQSTVARVPAVDAHLAIATDGEVLVSAPLP